MVIGFDGSRAFQKNRTGTENYSYYLLKAISEIDHKNKYVVYLQGAEPAYIKPDGGKWPENFEFKVINWRRFWTQGGLAIRTFTDKLDVLFVPAHTLPILRRPNLKTVVTVHDLGSEYLPSLHQLKQRIYLSFMQKIQLRGADKIIAVSKATKEDLVKRIGLKPGKISVVYEGYEERLFKQVKNDLLVNSLKQYDLKPKEYYLFVGTVQPRKNLERLIEAFAKTDKTLVIAGSKGWLSEGIYALPKKLGIENQIKFLGFVPEADLPALYSGAIAFTYPSLFEGFGLPILEAQACGCPVLTSNVSSMPEVAGKGAVYVDPCSVNDIVEGTNKISNQPALKKLIQSGFENIKRFSWKECAKETLQVLQSI